MKPQERAETISALVRSSHECDSSRSYEILEGALRLHLVLGTGHTGLGVDRVEVILGGQGRRVYEGYAGPTRRVLAGFRLGPLRMATGVTLVATHGTTNASEDFIFKPESLPEQANADRGNDLLVARLLHIAIYALAESGVQAIDVHPVHERLRAHYIAMGFAGGTRLDLRDKRSLERAFEYIERTYRDYGIEDLPPPPLLHG